jgi:hypothetical protein
MSLRDRLSEYTWRAVLIAGFVEAVYMLSAQIRFYSGKAGVRSPLPGWATLKLVIQTSSLSKQTSLCHLHRVIKDSV